MKYINNKAKKGIYKPVNENKLFFKNKNLVYRSSWEAKVFKLLDLNEDIEKWQSEPFYIYYYNPIKKKKSKYYPDLLIKVKNIKKPIIIEIKPKKDYIFSERCISELKNKNNSGSKRRKNLFFRYKTVLVNKCKWEAAKKYCDENNLDFVVINEDDIFKKWQKIK